MHVDYFHVSPEHSSVHSLLEQWAKWVRIRHAGWGVQPMFRQYRSHAWQWHTPQISVPVNTNTAQEVERVVSELPEKHRTAIRWAYVFQGNPAGMARQLMVTREGLFDLVDNGRTMVQKRLDNVKAA